MIDSIRKATGSLLLLDCGAVFSPQMDRANAELHLKAMERMGYDALNLGISELGYGNEFLERTSSLVSFPYIASNLLYEGVRPPWVREYIIKEVGGIRVAILGMFDPEDFKKIPNQDLLRRFEAIPPEAVFERLLPEVRGKSDLVILLSQLNETKNPGLLSASRGVDVIITSGVSNLFYATPPTSADFVLSTGDRGKAMGFAAVTLDDKGSLRITQRGLAPLDHSVPENAEVAALVAAYKKEKEISKEKMNRELTEGLKVTPQEFMERYRKRQTKQKNGEAQ